MQRASIRTRIQIPIWQGAYTADIFTFSDLLDHHEHIAIGLGPWATTDTPLVRIHSECLTGDVFGSMKCDCGKQLEEALERINHSGGFLIYLRQEGRGIGLYNKIDAYDLQAQGKNTFEANRLLGFEDDLRTYQVAAQMLLSLEMPRIQLLSNNPDKQEQLEQYGIEVEARIPTQTFTNEHNRAYLHAKAIHGGHEISFNDGVHLTPTPIKKS